MLSGENPPPDPPNLTTNGDDIDRPSRNKLPLAELDPPLDHRPKFSIRDYVFTARSKDIKNNWPFSLKNLQLCLKHGVKDPLPPFQPLDAVRNQPLNRCNVEIVTCPVEKQNTCKLLDGEPPGSDHHVALESCNDADSNHDDRAVTSVVNSAREDENDQFPSTTRSFCQSEIDSVPISKSSSGSVPLEAAGPCLKPQKPPAKKSRLIVKFGGTSDRGSAEDFATPSESMASIVCPVCKTFSSSSNTTLNAHIDQCLSAESTPKWTADSKLSRHRIKARKVKLMVDIYTTAKRCTLEELDRRNGTSWAAASSLAPNQDMEMIRTSNGGNDMKASSSQPEGSHDVGAVYIDASGTKLRILSKSNDDMPPASKSGDYLGPKKPLKGAKASKFLSTKRKRRHGMKHQKYLKLAHQSRKFFSHNDQASKMVGSQEVRTGMKDNFKSEEHQIRKQIISSDSTNLRERTTHLKRTFIPRKASDQDGHQPLIWKRHFSQDVQVQNDLTHSGDPVMEMNYVPKFKKLPPISIPLHENSERIMKQQCEGQPNDQRAHSSRKRPRSPLVVTGMRDKMERCFLSTKRNVTIQESQMLKPPKVNGNHVTQSSSKKVSVAAINNSSTSCSGNLTPASETLKFSSSKKNVLPSSGRLPMAVPRSNLVKKCSTTKKMHLHFSEDDDEEAAAWHFSRQLYELTDDDAEDQCERERATEEKRATLSVSARKEMDVLNSSLSASRGYSLEEVGNTNSSPRTIVEILENTDSVESVEGTATSLSKSVETKFQKVNNPCMSRSNTLPTIDDYTGSIYGGEGLASADDSRFVDKQRMYCAEEIAPGLIGQSIHSGADMDSEAMEGDSFPEVEPIPIPGPPGSFLPSPRDMGSDDFQGNSSLTTSRVQSSQEQLDLVDGESSDSPSSAVSTISNPRTLGSSLKHIEQPSSASVPAFQENNRSSFSGNSTEPSVEDAGMNNPQTNHEPERILHGEKFRANRIPIERRPFFFKNYNQPCCCQRKERLSQGLSLNFQESQLLRRRTVGSATASPIGVQGVGNLNVKPSNLDLMPGMFPFGSSRSYGSETALIMKPSVSPAPLKGFPDGVPKFSGSCDRDSASPSSSNPVLRLMGKNLMVGNKEDASVPLGPDESHAQTNQVTSQLPTSSGISADSNRNQDGQFLQHAVSQGSLIYGQNPHILVGQSVDLRPSNRFKNHGSLTAPQTPAQLSVGVFPERCVDHGFIASADSVKYEGNCDVPSRNSRSNNKKGQVPSFNMEKFTSFDHQYRNADACFLPKEIIVIDDTSENETSKTSAVVRHAEGLRENQLISPGISAASIPTHGIGDGSSFSSYQLQDSLRLGIQPVFQTTNFHAILSRRANTSPAKWGCTVEGSGLLQQNQHVAASPSTSNLRSVPYYSPSSS